MTEPTIADEELAPVLRLINASLADRQRLATVRALHPRGAGGLCPRCRVDWPCETAQAVGE